MGLEIFHQSGAHSEEQFVCEWETSVKSNLAATSIEKGKEKLCGGTT